MIITNLSTVYPNTYLKKDNIVLEISTRYSLREVYEKISAGEDTSETIVINAFKRKSEDGGEDVLFAPYRPPFAEDEVFFGDRVTVQEFEGYFYNKVGYEDFFEQVPVILSGEAEGAISKRQLLDYLAYAMEILPELETKNNLTLDEKLKLSETAKTFYKTDEQISAFNPLPSYEDLVFYTSLTSYEQRILKTMSPTINAQALSLARYCKDEKANGFGVLPIHEGLLKYQEHSQENAISLNHDFNRILVEKDGDSFPAGLPKELFHLISVELTNSQRSDVSRLRNVFYNHQRTDLVFSESKFLDAIATHSVEEIKRQVKAYLHRKACYFSADTTRNILRGTQNTLPAEIDGVIDAYQEEAATRFIQQGRFTSEALSEFVSSELASIYPKERDNLEVILEQKFQDKFRRAPRVLHEILRAYQIQKRKTALSETELNDIVDNFNLKSFQTIVKKNSHTLMNLSRYIDFSNIKAQHLQIFETKDIDVQDLENKGFFAWYAEHRDVNASELYALLEENPRRFELDKTAKQLIAKSKLKASYEEVERIREGWHINFEENDIAVKGRDIVVSNKNFTIEICDKDDPRQVTSGIDTNCCQRYGSVGGACVKDILLNPLSCNLIITDNQTGKIVAQSYIWSDIGKDALVLDNMEFAPEHDATVRKFFPLIAKWCEQMPHKIIHIGTGYNQSFKGVGVPVTSYTGCHRTILGNVNPRDWYSDYHSSGHNVARALKVDGVVTLATDERAVVSRKELKPSVLEESCSSPEDFLLLTLPNISSADDVRTFKEKASAGDDVEWVKRTVNLLVEKKNFSALAYFTMIPEAQQEIIFAADQSAVQFINNPTQSVLRKYLTLNPFMINKYPDLDVETVKHLYAQNGLLIRKAPTTNKECQRAAVQNEPLAILYLRDSEIFDELLLIAIQKKPEVIKFFPDVDNSYWNKAIFRNPYLIAYKKNPTKWQKETAIRKNPAIVYSIDNATKEDFDLAKSLLKRYRTAEREQQRNRAEENAQFNPFARM